MSTITPAQLQSTTIERIGESSSIKVQDSWNVAQKIQAFAADVFYVLCYVVLFPLHQIIRVSTRPQDLFDKHLELMKEGQEECQKILNPWDRISVQHFIRCGNQSFDPRAGKSANREEFMHWFNNEVTFMNRIRPYKIDLVFYQKKLHFLYPSLSPIGFIRHQKFIGELYTMSQNWSSRPSWHFVKNYITPDSAPDWCVEKKRFLADLDYSRLAPGVTPESALQGGRNAGLRLI